MENSPKQENTLENIEGSLEVSSAQESDVAICVIKPDAYEKREEIVKRLENSGLYVVRRSMAELNERFVREEMYPSTPEKPVPEPLMDATLRHLLSGPSEIVLVKGDDVVNKLIKAVGANRNPSLCDENTIRFIYSSHITEELEEGYKYWRNAAHRSMTSEEVEKNVKDFSKFLK